MPESSHKICHIIHKVQDIQKRPHWTGNKGHDRQNMTHRTGDTGQEIQDRRYRIGQEIQDRTQIRGQVNEHKTLYAIKTRFMSINRTVPT